MTIKNGVKAITIKTEDKPMSLDMTAAEAVKILRRAVFAQEYLEKMAQDSKDVQLDKATQDKKETGHADGRDFVLSFKEHKNVSKLVSSLKKAISFGENVQAWETKRDAIEAAKVVESAILTAGK